MQNEFAPLMVRLVSSDTTPNDGIDKLVRTRPRTRGFPVEIGNALGFWLLLALRRSTSMMLGSFESVRLTDMMMVAGPPAKLLDVFESRKNELDG